MRADIVPGGIFPDYELTDHTKNWRRLIELQRAGRDGPSRTSDPATAVS